MGSDHKTLLLLKSQIVFPAGKPYAVRILNYDSILVWTGTIHDA